MHVLIELLVQQSNLYLQQNKRNFLIKSEEMKAFIGVIGWLYQLLRTPMYWICNHFVGDIGIQNIFTRTRNQEVLHFANSKNQDKTDKGYKISPIINHLNESFRAVF